MLTDAKAYKEREEFSGTALRTLLSLLPEISTDGDDFSDLRPIKSTKQHYKLAVVSLTLTISVTTVLYWQFPLLRNSIITSLGNLVELITGKPTVAKLFISTAEMVMLFLIIRQLTKSRSAISNAALMEEKMFRAGSEKWSWHQRLRSNTIFGAGHLFNLIVFLAVVPGLAASGWWFMRVYRKTYHKTGSRNTALQEAGAVHAAHNTMVLYSIPLMLVSITIYLVIHPIS